jgi:GT2 family glycosyltransferase
VKVEIASATRKSHADFSSQSALGISLRRLAHDPRLSARIAAENRRGLPVIYNEILELADQDSIVVFIHDDVWIDDYFFSQRLNEALAVFDVVGVAGNRRRVPFQPAWPFVDRLGTWDQRENLSGSVAHGQHPFGPVSPYGETPVECELLDGVMLAAKKSVLTGNKVAFDPIFDFHFYDMDFCRTARRNGLRLGTWPICLTHQSAGAFGTEPWTNKYRAYLDKWGD